MFFYLPFVWYEDRKGRERKEETQEREMYILFACPLKYVILSLMCFFFFGQKKNHKLLVLHIRVLRNKIIVSFPLSFASLNFFHLYPQLNHA